MVLLRGPFFGLLLTAFSAISSAQTFQAEAGTLIGVSTSTSVSGYSGSGFVTGFDAAGDKVIVWPWITTAGSYTLTVRYRASTGEKRANVIVNDVVVKEISLPACTGWCNADAGSITLGTGSIGVGIQSNWGWYDIDSLTLTQGGTSNPPPSSGAPSNAPVDGQATSSARALLKYIQKQYASYKTLSGQQDYTSLNWVISNIGKTPAILGEDFMDYSPSRVERGTTSRSVEEAITHDQRGGIVTFCWHWNAPTGLYNTAGKEWYRGFYTDSTSFDVNAALNEGVNGNNYKLLLRDIDAIAVQIRRLSNANVPILWRPLHEADGTWFWWGAKGASAYIRLWNLMYDRLVNYHGLHNMIWVCNFSNVKSEWYPGNSKCDIVSIDVYASQGDHGPLQSQYDQLKSISGGQRVIALGEVGGIPDPSRTGTSAPWAFWVTWAGDFITGGGWNPKSFVQTVMNHANIINVDKLGNWKSTT